MDKTQEIEKICEVYISMLEEGHDPTSIYASIGVYIYHEAKKRLPEDERFEELMLGAKDIFFEGDVPELEPDGSQTATILKGLASKIVSEYKRKLHDGDS